MERPDRVGEYRIVRELGRGGMGVVYEAIQESLGRRVALKLLTGLAANDTKMIERFGREARAAASLSHPGIVQVHGVGQEDGLHYIAMEFVDGASLSDHIRGFWDPEGAPLKTTPGTLGEQTAGSTFHLEMETTNLSPDSVAPTSTELGRGPLTTTRRRGRRLRPLVQLIMGAARALHSAHEASVLHRDVKPGNLLVNEAGAVKVADFGLARMLDGDERLTLTGDVMGTPSYVSPEQVLGAEVDAQSDVYSLGVTLYEAVCGRLPFIGDNVQSVLHQVLNKEPPSPRRANPDLPRDLETITLKAMEKAKGRRYSSAAEMADDLQRWLNGEPILARPASPVTRVAKLIMRRRGVAAALALCVIIAAVAILNQSRTRSTQRRMQAERSLEAGISSAIQGDHENALGHLTTAISFAPEVRYGHALRGVIHLKSGYGEDAHKDLDTARRTAPEDPVTRLAWEYHRRRSGAGLEGRSEAEATAEGQDLLELDAIALANSWLGRYRDAHALFTAARARDRQRIPSLVGLGFAAFNLGRYNEAKEAFNALKALMPATNPLPRVILVYCLRQQASRASPQVRAFLTREARALVKELTDTASDSPYTSLACAMADDMAAGLRRERPPHAPEACVAHVVETVGMDQLPALFHEIAGLVLARRDPEVARKHALEALRKHPESERARVTLGLVQLTKGDDAFAAVRFREAVLRTPDAAETISTIIRGVRRPRIAAGLRRMGRSKSAKGAAGARSPRQPTPTPPPAATLRVEETTRIEAAATAEERDGAELPGEQLLVLCRRLILIAPDDAEGLILAADTLREHGDDATAREGYTLAIEKARSQERTDLERQARSLLEAMGG